MTRETRQKLLLAVLLVVLAFVAVRTVRQFSGSGSPGAVGRPAATREARDAGAAAGSGFEIVELELDRLQQKPGEFEPGRDPFRYRQNEAPKAPPPRRKPKPQPQRPKPQPAAQQQPARPSPPTPDFVFLGSFGPEEKRIAVFSDKQEIFNVMEGDVLKEDFVVRKIGYESADVGFVHFPEEPARRLEAGG